MAYEKYLTELVKRDDRFVVMTAENRAAIRNLPKLIGDKFIDVGIAEQTMIGAAAGLALRGRIPVVHALAAFLVMRAFEFIRTDVSIANLPVKLVGAVPGLLSEANGPTHQAVEDIGLMRLLPNVEIFCPADEDDMLLGLEYYMKSPNPAYIRYNNNKSIVTHSSLLKPGEVEIISEGEDITILTYGYLFNEAYKAQQVLLEKGFSVGLLHVRSLNPLDETSIIDNIKKSYLNVVIEDHYQKGGLYSLISELMAANKICANLTSISLKEKWFKPTLMHNLLSIEGFTGKQIADKIMYQIKNKILELTENKD